MGFRFVLKSSLDLDEDGLGPNLATRLMLSGVQVYTRTPSLSLEGVLVQEDTLSILRALLVRDQTYSVITSKVRLAKLSHNLLCTYIRQKHHVFTTWV